MIKNWYKKIYRGFVLDQQLEGGFPEVGSGKGPWAGIQTRDTRSATAL